MSAGYSRQNFVLASPCVDHFINSNMQGKCGQNLLLTYIMIYQKSNTVIGEIISYVCTSGFY